MWPGLRTKSRELSLTKNNKVAVLGAIMGERRLRRGTLWSGAQAWPSFINQEPADIPEGCPGGSVCLSYICSVRLWNED